MPLSGGRALGRLERIGVVLAWLAAAGPLLFLAVPLLSMVWRMAQERSELAPVALTTLRDALILSLITSGLSLAVIIVFGTPLAYLLSRRRFRGAHLVETLIDLPIVLPPAGAGIALLVAFGRYGLVGQWLNAFGVIIGFTTAAVVLAQVFIAAPFFVRAARSGFARVDRDLEEAASDLGASPTRVLSTVTLPMAMPSLVAGAVLAWARALGEFGATIMFAGTFPGITQSMPLAIYGRFGAGDMQSALLLSLVLSSTSIAILLSLRVVAGRWGALPGPS